MTTNTDPVLIESITKALLTALMRDDGPLFVRVRRRDLGDAIRVMIGVIHDSGDPVVEARLVRALALINAGSRLAHPAERP